jgi:hypothetical protein
VLIYFERDIVNITRAFVRDDLGEGPIGFEVIADAWLGRLVIIGSIPYLGKSGAGTLD